MQEKNKGNIFSIGLLAGHIGMLLGWLVGALLVSGIRLIMGLKVWELNPAAKAFGFTEPAWVLGALFGAIGFILATGVTNDWLKWMKGEETARSP